MLTLAVIFFYFGIVFNGQTGALRHTASVPPIWKVADSFFSGAEDGLTWNAVFQPNNPANGEGVKVTVGYGNAKIHSFSEAAAPTLLACHNFKLQGQEVTLSLYRQYEPSPEAVYPPPIHYKFSFCLQAGEKLRLLQEYRLTLGGGELLDKQTEFSEDRLPESVRAFKRDLEKKDEAALKPAGIVSLAEWLLFSSHPLDSPEEKIIIGKVEAAIGNNIFKLSSLTPEGELEQFKLPARQGDQITLFPQIWVQRRTPYRDRVETDLQPLPGYALVFLESTDGIFQEFGEATETPGRFKIGTWSLANLRKLRLRAAFPLWPPGDRPSIDAEMLIRNGRSVEKLLDHREFPRFDPLPRELSKKELISAILKQTAAAVNPDTGEVIGLQEEGLLDLYDYAGKELHAYPELNEILRQAYRRDRLRENNSPEAYRGNFLHGAKWTERDTHRVLEHPEDAPSLAKKIKQTFFPGEIDYRTKGGGTEQDYREFPLDEREQKALRPQALAAAALVKADPLKYSDLAIKILFQLEKAWRSSSKTKLSLEDLITFGQAMKLVSHYSRNTALSKKSAQLLEAARDEAWRRFKENTANYNLSQEIALGHLFSPLWRRYWPTGNKTISGQPCHFPEQTLGINPESGVGKKLELDRRGYQAALKRRVAELKNPGLTKQERQRDIEDFLKSWHKFLFAGHKGGWLQSYEKQLEQDRIWALDELNQP